MDDAPPREGLFAPLRGLLVTLLATLQVRLALFATEIAEERLRIVRALVFGAIAFFLLGAGTVFIAAVLTVLLWGSHPELALAAVAALLLGGGAVALTVALRALRAPSQLFAASLAELARDRDTLD